MNFRKDRGYYINAKVDGPKISKWTVLRAQTERSLADGPKGLKWTAYANMRGKYSGKIIVCQNELLHGT